MNSGGKTALMHAQYTAVLYPNNQLTIHTAEDLLMREDVHFFQAAPAQFHAKPNPYPNLTLIQTFPRVLHRAVPVPGEAAIVLTETQVAVRAQTRCRILRL